MTVLCVCGHPQEAHEHFRSGHDCGVCGVAGCRRYRPAGRGGLGELLRRVLRTGGRTDGPRPRAALYLVPG